jgi:hypothetical protein
MNYKTPIKSAIDAQNFIVALHKADKLFHFDDSPENIVARDGAPLFADADIADVKSRVMELFEYIDPFEWAIALINYPTFFELGLADIESHVDVIWAMRVPDGDDARNLDEDTQNELDALELARKYITQTA